MDNLDLLECCQSVLNFIQDKDEVLINNVINFTESETMKEMDRVLVKNDFKSSVFGTNMMNFMRWLSNEYNFDSPDIYDDGRSYFSDGFKFPKAPAKTFLKAVIREIKIKELLCQKE
jgi:hypothetical protein